MKRISILIFALLITLTSFAQQQHGNFTDIRLVNGDSILAGSADGTIWYNRVSHKFRYVENGVKKSFGAGGSGAVSSVFGRTGAVTAQSNDYTFAQLASKPTTISGYGITDPIVLTSGSYSNPSWITALAWSKITGTPTTISGYGITDPIVLTSGSYSNPSWITGLAWSKITGTPTTISGYGLTDALSNALTTGHFYVGNGSNIATDVAMSGDATLSSSGAVSIGAGKVTNTMLAGSIAASKLIGTDINTVGTIGTGTWQGTAIADAYISSASTWNAKVSSQWVTTGSDIYYNTGNVMIGAASAPSSKLHVSETSTSATRGFLNDQYGNNTSGSKDISRKARGTFSSPATIVTGDALGNKEWQAHDGTSFVSSAKILVNSTGTVSTGVIPTTMAFQTTNSSGTLTTGLTLDQLQNVTIVGTVGASNFSGSHSGTSSGTNTGDQTITLTGDITGSGTGSLATTIGTNKVVTTNITDANVTLAKMANVATATVFYRKTAGTGVPEVQTLATLKTDLGLTGSNSGDQTITLTGDVTGSGTGSFATTLTNASVTGQSLTGYVSGSGTVSATDNILQAIQKLNGNDGLKWQVSGTTNVTTPTINGNVSWTQSSQSSTNTFQSWTQATHTGGTPKGWVFNAGAHTTLTASGNPIDFDFNAGRIVQLNTGAVGTYTSSIFRAPTLAFVGASAVTTAATLTIDNQVQAGTNATITKPKALWVQAGETTLDGNLSHDAATTWTIANTANNNISFGTNGSSRLSILGNGGMQWTGVAGSGASNNYYWLSTQAAGAAGLATGGFRWIAGAHTNAPTGAEIIDIYWNTGRNFQFAAGALPLNRTMLLEGPAYRFVSSSTLTDAVTLEVSAPTASTNATITRAWAARLLGNVAIGASMYIGDAAGTTAPTSTLTMGGSFAVAYVAKTANYTLTSTDYLVNCTSNSFTSTLPTAVGITGRMYIIKNTGSGTITLATTSSQTIDGSAPGSLTAGPTVIRLMSDGANWITW